MPGLDAVEPDGSNRAAGGKQRVVDGAATGQHGFGLAVFQAVDDHEIGTPAGGDKAAVAKTESAGGRDRCGAVDGERFDAFSDRFADHVVEMAFLGDIQRIAVIGAERQEGRQALGEDRHQRVQVLGDGAFAHQNVHALADFLQRFGCRGALVIRADPGGKIAVEIKPAEQRRMAIDMTALEGIELGKTDRVLVDDAGEVHEFRQTDDLFVVAERQELFDRQIGAGCLQMGSGHAARELDADIHDRLTGGIEEILDALGAEHIGDLMWIADHGGDAIRQDAAVEFMRRDQRGSDMQVGIDEARYDDLAGYVDFARPGVIAACADDAVTADGDVGRNQFAGDEVKEPSALEHDIGGDAAGALIDQLFQFFAHGPVSYTPV